MELSRVLADVYASRGLARMPFAVTGQLCLGRGITFQSASFTFDAAIIPTMKDAASAYQCVARVLGNISTFTGPFTATVYMGSKLLAAVQRQECVAMNLARLVHEGEVPSQVGAEEVRIAAGDRAQTVSHLEEFSTMEGLRARWEGILRRAGKTGETPRTPRRKDDEYVCSVGKKSEKQLASLIREKFPDGCGTANWGSGITDDAAQPGDYVHRVYAGYEEDGSVTFFLRWAVKA